MKNRVAVTAPLLVALSLALGTLASAAPIELIATGTVVSKSADSLVVKTDDHGHRISFVVDRSTVLPEGLAAGRHVRIVYHAMGSTGQTAERVTFVDGGPKAEVAGRTRKPQA